MRKNRLRKIPVVLAIALAGIVIFSGAIMLLWNGILPAVLHVGSITFLQAAGIFVLAKLLFGGFKGRRFAGGCRQKYILTNGHHMTHCDESGIKNAE